MERKLPFVIEAALVRFQRAVQDEGECGGRARALNASDYSRLYGLQQVTNDRRADLEAAILDHLKS